MATTTVWLAQPPAATQISAAGEVDRRVGAGVAFNPDLDRQSPPAAIPTGSAALDAALGVAGILESHHRGLRPRGCRQDHPRPQDMLKRSRPAGPPASSTPSTPWTSPGPPPSAST